MNPVGAQVAGKVAVVTGGASGIGEACSETLAREGAAVLITDIDDALGKDVAQRITKAGGKAHYLRHDVRDEAGWPGVVAEAEKRFGRLDIMVANAGIGVMAPIAEMTLADCGVPVRIGSGGQAAEEALLARKPVAR
jgi:NAD(P)-dependent dehydrogenase (short-subunit alcohol dehydrogenase family)